MGCTPGMCVCPNRRAHWACTIFRIVYIGSYVHTPVIDCAPLDVHLVERGLGWNLGYDGPLVASLAGMQPGFPLGNLLPRDVDVHTFAAEIDSAILGLSLGCWTLNT